MQNPYESMLPQLARFAARHPNLYRARIVALAALGYGLLLGIVFFLVALELALVWAIFATGAVQILKLAIPLLLLIGLLVEALWIEIPVPRGIAVSRAEAPALWAEIDRVRKELRAPAPYQVLVTSDLNAAVTQLPRLGILGFYRTYLIIGLPLAASCTPDEFRALLGHEFGHVSGRHTRLGLWTARVRITWREVLANLEGEQHWTRGLFRAFMRWYAPYFEACTAVLQRADEFEADRDAARVAGSKTAASMLCRTDMADRYMSNVFWPAVEARVADGPRAPAGVFSYFLREGAGASQHADAAAWLREAAVRRTEPWDTHPSLSERLASLGAPAAVPAAPARPSAAEALFGAHAEKLADQLSRKWMNDAQFNWRRLHEQYVYRTRQLEGLEAWARSEPLPPAQARDRIVLTVQVHGETVAMPLMRDFVAAGWDDATVHFLWGRTLLAQGDEAGLDSLKRAMELDMSTIPTACALAVRFLEERGRAHEAGAFQIRAENYLRAVKNSEAERNPESVTHRDHFLPHGLDDAQVQALAAALARERGLRRVMLVRKKLAVLTSVPCHVLAIEFAQQREPGAGELPEHLARRVAGMVPVPGTLTVVRIDPLSRLARALGQVPGAELYHSSHRVPAAV